MKTINDTLNNLPNLKNLAEFRATKEAMTIEEGIEYLGLNRDDFSDDLQGFLIYSGLYIEVLTDGRYYLLVERSDYINEDLELLESILWDDFAKYELSDMNDREMYEELLERTPEEGKYFVYRAYLIAQNFMWD